jgi:hypothetical protein
MVEATVAMRNGEVKTVYADDFNELDKMLDWEDVVQIVGKTIKLTDMRQGKERLQA